MKMVIELPEKTIAHIRSEYGHGKGFYPLNEEDKKIVNDAIYFGTPLPKDATNGDIYINIFHPYRVKENGTCMWIWYTKDEYENGGTYYTMSTDWWNAPHKAESEDKE